MEERDRFLERELRMEGHQGPRTSTSPTCKRIEEDEDISQYKRPRLLRQEARRRGSQGSDGRE